MSRRAFALALLLSAVGGAALALGLRRFGGGADPEPPPGPADAAPLVRGYGGALGEAVLRLAPLHGEEILQAHEAGLLAARYRLGAGEPWRLELLAPAGDGGLPTDLSVADGEGTALAPLAPRLGGATDPLARLLSLAGAPTGDGARTWILWGRRPAGPVRLIVPSGARAGEHALAPLEIPCDALPRQLARLHPPGADGGER